MNPHSFCPDLKERILRVVTDELTLYHQGNICAQIALADEVILPEKSGLLITAQMEGLFEKGAVAMLQPRRGILGYSKGKLRRHLVVLGKKSSPNEYELPPSKVKNRYQSESLLIYHVCLFPRENEYNECEMFFRSREDDDSAYRSQKKITAEPVKTLISQYRLTK